MYGVYMCVHKCDCVAYMCVHVLHTCVCMWRPEVYIGYLALLLSTLSFEQGVPPNLKSMDWLT